MGNKELDTSLVHDVHINDLKIDTDSLTHLSRNVSITYLEYISSSLWEYPEGLHSR